MTWLRRHLPAQISTERITGRRLPALTRELIAGRLESISTWALAGLLITLPFWRHRVLLHRGAEAVFFEFHDIVLYTNDFLWCGALGAWLLSRLVQRAPGELRLGPRFIWGPLLGFLAVAAIGVPFAVDPLYAGYQTARLFLLFTLYLLLLNMRPARGAIAWPLAAGIVIQAIVALPQFALGRTLGLTRLGEVSAHASWPGASVVVAGQESWLRAYGFAQHPNLLAGCLMAMLLIVAGYYLGLRDWKRLPALAALGLGCVALLLTFSRAAWLGALFGSLAALALLRRPDRRPTLALDRSTVTLLGAVLIAISATFVAANGPLLRSRFGLATQATEIESVEARKSQVPAALALIQTRPVLGVGLGNYTTALYTLVPEAGDAEREYQPVFNVPLLFTAELGIVGGALWLLLITSPWLALWRRCRRSQLSYWWAGLSAALLALTVVSFFDFYVWASHQGQLALWIVLGLWAREWEESE